MLYFFRWRAFMKDLLFFCLVLAELKLKGLTYGDRKEVWVVGLGSDKIFLFILEIIGIIKLFWDGQ